MSQTPLSLEGRVAIVVGAGKGRGRAVALGLAEAGADVAVMARTTEDLDTLAAEIRELRRRALTVRADATASAEVERAVAAIVADYGQIDVLVNAVGGNLRKPLVETTDADWDASRVPT